MRFLAAIDGFWVEVSPYVVLSILVAIIDLMQSMDLIQEVCLNYCATVNPDLE